jgi:hypothetical protein
LPSRSVAENDERVFPTRMAFLLSPEQEFNKAMQAMKARMKKITNFIRMIIDPWTNRIQCPVCPKG